MLYARNLTQEITEDALKEEFEHYGTVERVKKIKDYAFVHFEDRDCAVKVRNINLPTCTGLNYYECFNACEDLRKIVSQPLAEAISAYGIPFGFL